MSLALYGHRKLEDLHTSLRVAINSKEEPIKDLQYAGTRANIYT
jgi:hypothetical protein